MTEFLSSFLEEAVFVFTSGGWLMIPLILLALVIYGTAFSALAFLSEHRFYDIDRDQLAKVVTNPILADREVREILEYTCGDRPSVEEVRDRFEEVRIDYVDRVERRLRFMLILASTAPLVGLLGTVTGMLATFQGLAVNAGGETVDLVASGISEALVTTQTGLVIAIIAYIIGYRIARLKDRMDACLESIETLSVQLREKELAEPVT